MASSRSKTTSDWAKLAELKAVLADARADSGHMDFQAMQGERAEYLLWELSDVLIEVTEAAEAAWRLHFDYPANLRLAFALAEMTKHKGK